MPSEVACQYQEELNPAGGNIHEKEKGCSQGDVKPFNFQLNCLALLLHLLSREAREVS